MHSVIGIEGDDSDLEVRLPSLLVLKGTVCALQNIDGWLTDMDTESCRENPVDSETASEALNYHWPPVTAD